MNFITREDWKDRDLGKFARELGEFYVGLGQQEPSLMEKFDKNIDDEFIKQNK